jgi:hypothetical protein
VLVVLISAFLIRSRVNQGRREASYSPDIFPT